VLDRDGPGGGIELAPDIKVAADPAVSGDSETPQVQRVRTLEHVFAGFQLFWHQEQALRLGSKRTSFVVTSGTGSGKSLTYLGTVFHGLFSKGYGKRG
jgi:ATP-dependent helicase YprA (DUF1998 family)